jgi:hypothetical protein
LEPVLHDNAGATGRCREFFVDTVYLLPIVHGVNEDSAGEEIVRKFAEAVHGHRQDDEVGVTDDRLGRDRVGAGSEHLNDQSMRSAAPEPDISTSYPPSVAARAIAVPIFPAPTMPKRLSASSC